MPRLCLTTLAKSQTVNYPEQTKKQLFDTFFRKYHRWARAFAYKHVNDLNIADDIVQDVFFEIWLRNDDLDFTDELKPYLFKSTYNKCINYLNQKYTREKISLENHPDNSFFIQVHDSSTNLENDLLYKELDFEIKNCIENLPEQCKKVYKLKHQFGLKNKEIAERLNINIKTVEKHITNALIKLRSHLKKLDLLSFLILSIVKIFILR